LIRPQKNRKFRDGDRCNIASYKKNKETKDLLKIYFNQKILNFLCTIESLSFNGKEFLFFVERGKVSRKKLNKFSYGKITWKKVCYFFVDILHRSTKNKDNVPLKLNELIVHRKFKMFWFEKI
jgi:hypothetical protein